MPQVVAVAAAWVAKTITVKAVTAFVVKTVLQVAATVALSKAAKALGLSKQSIQERQASVTQLSLGEVPREAILGMACTGGSLLDAFNFGGKYGTDTVTRVIALADHLLDGIVGYFVDDVFYNWTNDGVQPGFNGKLSIEFKNGFAGGNVPPLHVRQSGGWTASDVLAGVAHVVVDTRFDEAVWTQGHPRLKFVVRGLRVYDPRRDPALGYTGPDPQTWADTSTHTFSRNAALLRYAYTRGIYATGHQGEPQHLLIGRGLSAEEAPPARIIAAANLCDEAVDGEIRYTADGVIAANQAFIEVEELFAAAMAGVIVQREGGVVIEPGQAKAAVVTITDGDLVIGKPIGATPFLPDSDGGRINTIVPRYVEPTQGWLDHAAPVIRDLSRMAPAPIGDGGPREMTLPLALVIRASQANGNGAIALRKAALERRATVTLPPRFAGLEEGDWIAWKSDRRHGGATVRYRIVSFSLNAEWQNSLVLEEIASSVYGVPDPVEDRTLPPPAPTPIDALQLFGVQAEAITLAGDTSTLPAVRFSWDVATADTAMTAIRAEVRRVGETDAAPTRIDNVGRGQASVTNGVGPDQALECRVVPIGDPSRPVLASNWITVSTSGVVAADVSATAPVILQQRADIDALADLQDSETVIRQEQIDTLTAWSNQAANLIDNPSGAADPAGCSTIRSWVKEGGPNVQLINDQEVGRIFVVGNYMASQVYPASPGQKHSLSYNASPVGGGHVRLQYITSSGAVEGVRVDNSLDEKAERRRSSAPSVAPAGTTGFRLLAVPPSGGVLPVWAIKVNFGEVATDFTDDYSANVLQADVSITKTIVLDLDGQNALARLSLVAAASGSVPARIGLTSSTLGSAITFDAPYIYWGANTVFDDATDTLQTTVGSNVRVLAFGAPFGASGNLLEWWGPASIGLGAMTTGNGLNGRMTTAPYVFDNVTGGARQALVSVTDRSVTTTWTLMAQYDMGGVSAGPNGVVVAADFDIGTFLFVPSGSGVIDFYGEMQLRELAQDGSGSTVLGTKAFNSASGDPSAYVIAQGSRTGAVRYQVWMRSTQPGESATIGGRVQFQAAPNG